MATISQAVERIRLRIRDPRATAFSDEEVLSTLRSAAADVHRLLASIGSTLVYATHEFTTTAGTREYIVPGLASPLPDVAGVYLGTDSQPLSPIAQHDLLRLGDTGDEPGRPLRYYLTAPSAGTAKIGLSPIPDDAYTITLFHVSDPPAFSASDSTPMPYGGIWDDYLMYLTAIELREILEGDVSFLIARADAAYNAAMRETYRRGIRTILPAPQGNFFMPKGT